MLKIDYNNSLINITASLLRHYNCFIDYKTYKPLDQFLAKDYNHIILILLDGLGFNILNENKQETKAFHRNLKTKLHSVFPPTTVAATNALLSGKPPFVSGYVGWMQYSKFEDCNVVVFKNEDYDNPKNILKSNLKEEHLSYKSFVQKIKEKNKDIHVEELYPSFHKKGYETFDDQLNRLLMITKKEKSFSYCYFDDPDLTIHTSGINGSKTKETLSSLNNSYERFLNEINDDVLVIITADHGLLDVDYIDLYKYNDIVETFKRRPSLEARTTTFFIKEGLENNFKILFNKYFGASFKLLTKKELYNSELLGYGVKHKLLDSFIGDFIAISTTNKAFKLKEGNFFKAHHAGLTKEEIEVPLIINKEE